MRVFIFASEDAQTISVMDLHLHHAIDLVLLLHPINFTPGYYLGLLHLLLFTALGFAYGMGF